MQVCENHFYPHVWNRVESGTRGETLEYCAQTRALVQFFFFRTHDRTPRKTKEKEKEKKKLRPALRCLCEEALAARWRRSRGSNVAL